MIRFKLVLWMSAPREGYRELEGKEEESEREAREG
jgi:hypothetical protein